jgi:hypothetical protein
MDDWVSFASREYFALLSLLLVARGADFLSTWVATPHLILEGNPLARRLGWRWGVFVNLLVSAGFGLWPLAAIVVATTSFLVAARNFQSAWLMRTLGEAEYRDWHVDRIREVRLPLYLFCLGGQILLTAAVGGGLMYFAEERQVPFAIGLGVVTYALAVTLYTLLAVWRIRRA